MIYSRLTERALEMVDAAVSRSVAFDEVVDAIDVSLTIFPTPDGGVGFGALIYIALKGPVIGTTLGNIDLVTDVGLLSSQKFLDDRVRVAFETLRAQRAGVLASANGSTPILQ